MELKDWIQIIVEIIGNGIVLAIFGKWLDIKLKRAERKDELHSSTVKLFLEELIKLNKALIKVSTTVQMKKAADASEVWKLLEENVLTQWIEIITVYDTYEHELIKFENQYRKLEYAWNEFTRQTTPQGYGEKLEMFKKNNKDLIAIVSKEY